MSVPTGTVPVTDFDLRLLRVFKTIVEEGGLKPAQAALDLGLPTISKYLSDLEARFGVRLCRRGSQRFELTPEGEIIHKAVLKLFAELDRFQSEVDEVRNGVRGEIRIGVIDNTISDPNSPLVDALENLEGDGLHLRLSVLDPETIQQRILDGRLDVGIVTVFRKRKGLEYRTIYTEQMYLYCGSKHPLFEKRGDLTELELENYAFVDHGYVDGTAVDGFFPPSLKGATAWQVEAVAMLIMTGRFLGYLPKHYADDLVQQGRLRQLKGARSGYSSPVAAVLRTTTVRTRPIRRLLQALEQGSAGSAKPNTLLAGESGRLAQGRHCVGAK